MKISKDNIEGALLSASEFATLLGVTVQRVNQLKDEGSLTPAPGDGHTKFIFGPALREYTARIREKAAGRLGESQDGDKLDPQYEKARLTKNQADMLELQLAKAQGEVVSSEEILEVWQRIISSARSRIMSLPTRLPNMIHHLTKKDVQIIEDEVREVLERLAADGEESLSEVQENALESGETT